MPAPLPDISRDHQCYHYQAPTGLRCGSPAIKGEYYCYHHLVKDNYKKKHRVLIDPEVTCMELPPIEDRASIFNALAAVIHRLAENTIDTRRAGQMIYGLQVAMRALEPPRSQRSRIHPTAETQPGAEGASTTNSEPQPATCNSQSATPKTIQITKESLLYFLRSRHCYNCNTELFPPEELTYRRNPGAPPEVIEEANPRLPAPVDTPTEPLSLSEPAQPDQLEPIGPATADPTVPRRSASPKADEQTIPTHPGGILPSIQAAAEPIAPAPPTDPASASVTASSPPAAVTADTQLRRSTASIPYPFSSTRKRPRNPHSPPTLLYTHLGARYPRDLRVQSGASLLQTAPPASNFE